MRKRLIPLLAAFAIAVDSPPHVEAGAFATEYTQLLNHAQLVMEYIRQGEQLANEIRMYADMIRNSQRLSGQVLGSIASDINRVANIVRGGQALAYSLGNLDQLFRTTYPGYQTTPGTYYLNYRRWSHTSLDTALGVLRAAGLQGQQLEDEEAVEASLQSMIQNSDGRMQALQALGGIADQQVQQLMKLRQLMLADLSSKQAYQAAMLQHQAAGQAATEWFFTTGPVRSDGKTFLPGVH